MAVTYEKAHREKAKVEGLHLVTLDIVGKHAKREGVTYQGFLLTQEQVDFAWKFFEWLALGKRFESTPAPVSPES